MLSLVKQSTLKPQSQNTAIILNKEKNTRKPKVKLCHHILFQTEIRQQLYSSNTCAFTEIIQCHIHKSVFFPLANLSAFYNLPSLPAWIHTDEMEFTAVSGTSSIFIRNDITAVPISQLLLWEVFHILAVPS